MSLPPPRIYQPYQDKQLLPEIAQIHADCITFDHQLATFMPPLSRTRMLDYWLSISEDVEKSRKLMIVQFAAEDEAAVAGYVCLTLPTMEIAPFHGEVHHLMVSPQHRKKGVARSLMEKLESVALGRGVKLLTLSSTIGLPAADQVYPRLGYIEYGVIPKCGISPEDGRLMDERFFYKDLRDQDQ